MHCECKSFYKVNQLEIIADVTYKVVILRVKELIYHAWGTCNWMTV